MPLQETLRYSKAGLAQSLVEVTVHSLGFVRALQMSLAGLRAGSSIKGYFFFWHILS